MSYFQFYSKEVTEHIQEQAKVQATQSETVIARNISCGECGKDLGEVHDATLLKNIVHLCGECNTSRLLLKMSERVKGARAPDYSDMFGEIFGKSDLFKK